MSDELVEAIRKQAEAAEGNNSFASLATWIGDHMAEQAAPAAEPAQESPGFTGDRTIPTPGPVKGPNDAIVDLFSRAIAEQGDTNLFDHVVYPE